MSPETTTGPGLPAQPRAEHFSCSDSTGPTPDGTRALVVRRFVVPPHLVENFLNVPDELDRDEALQHLALAMRWLGWEQAPLIESLTALIAERPAESRFPRFPAPSPEAEAKWAWRSAVMTEALRIEKEQPQWTPRLGRRGVVRYLEAVAGEVERGAFAPGRRGDSQRKLMRSIVQFALGLDEPKAVVGIDVRTMSDIAQMGEQARRRALRALVEQGWLKPQPAQGTDNRSALRYLLRAPLPTPDLTRLALEDWGGFGPWSPSHPIWHGHGIAEPGRQLLVALRSGGPYESDAGWYRAARIESATTAKRWKNLLLSGKGMDVPLVERTDAGWQLVENIDEQMQLLAEELGLVAKSEARTARHRRERKNFHDYFAEPVEPWEPDESDDGWIGGPFDENATAPDDLQPMLLHQVANDPRAALIFLWPSLERLEVAA